MEYDRTRRDTLTFFVCLLLSLVTLSLPAHWQDAISSRLRETVLFPFLALQRQSELSRTSRQRFEAVTAERDSAALRAMFLDDIQAENVRLRSLLSLGERLGTGFIPAEVLHQAQATDAVSVVISAGRSRGVRALSPVVTPEGLLGVVSEVDARTAVVATWAHPEFRASAMSLDGRTFGIATPHGGSLGPAVALLELTGVAYRDTVPAGTVIVTSGLGGVLPRGLPLGTVIGVASEEAGWQRTYLVRPALHPSAASHVMVLLPARARSDLTASYGLDSTRGDSIP
jgi:rod shape-determining protein MreC